jgi:hypothetical protein
MGGGQSKFAVTRHFMFFPQYFNIHFRQNKGGLGENGKLANDYCAQRRKEILATVFFVFYR